MNVRTWIRAWGVVAVVLPVLVGCDRNPTSLFAPPAAGLVRGLVSAVDGSRTPEVTLTLRTGSAQSAQFEVVTDAGGAYAFPAVAVGAWTLELGPLPSNWRMAPGQEASRLVLVVMDEIARENFVLERVP